MLVPIEISRNALIDHPLWVMNTIRDRLIKFGVHRVENTDWYSEIVELTSGMSEDNRERWMSLLDAVPHQFGRSVLDDLGSGVERDDEVLAIVTDEEMKQYASTWGLDPSMGSIAKTTNGIEVCLPETVHASNRIIDREKWVVEEIWPKVGAEFEKFRHDFWVTRLAPIFAHASFVTVFDANFFSHFIRGEDSGPSWLLENIGNLEAMGYTGRIKKLSIFGSRESDNAILNETNFRQKVSQPLFERCRNYVDELETVVVDGRYFRPLQHDRVVRLSSNVISRKILMSDSWDVFDGNRESPRPTWTFSYLIQNQVEASEWMSHKEDKLRRLSKSHGCDVTLM